MLFFIKLMVIASVAVFMLLYGAYVISEGKVSAGNGTMLYSNSARFIGILYLLPLPIAYIGLQFYSLLSLSHWLSVDEIAYGYESTLLNLSGLTTYLTLFVIIKMSNRLYEKQQSGGLAAGILAKV